MDRSATHIPISTPVVIKSEGPILEMGCGCYSTSVLHEICRLDKRKLISLDSNTDWVNKFSSLVDVFHEIYFVKDWSLYTLIDEMRWGVVLIDHAPEERRRVDIDRLKNNADYLVIHDTEAAIYKYEPVLSKFKYRFDYKLVEPWTTIVSNTKSLNFLER